jgi:hypothetical protein
VPRGACRTTIGVLAAAIALLVSSGCSSREADVVRTALDKQIDSATVAIAFSMKMGGERVEMSLNGPYSSNGEKDLPTVDWRVRAVGLTPKPIRGRVITTAKNAFVEYEGVLYEAGEARIAQLDQQGGGSDEELGTADLKRMLKNAKRWFPTSDTKETAQLGGEQVTRVTGKLDLAAAWPDLMEMSGEQAGVPTVTAKQLEDLVSDPRFTLDVGKKDGAVRRIAVSLDIRKAAGGGKIHFGMRFKDVGTPVAITPPATGTGRPLEELTPKLRELLGTVAPASASGLRTQDPS